MSTFISGLQATQQRASVRYAWTKRGHRDGYQRFSAGSAQYRGRVTLAEVDGMVPEYLAAARRYLGREPEGTKRVSTRPGFRMVLRSRSSISSAAPSRHNTRGDRASPAHPPSFVQLVEHLCFPSNLHSSPVLVMPRLWRRRLWSWSQPCDHPLMVPIPAAPQNPTTLNTTFVEESAFCRASRSTAGAVDV